MSIRRIIKDMSALSNGINPMVYRHRVEQKLLKIGVRAHSKAYRVIQRIKMPNVAHLVIVIDTIKNKNTNKWFYLQIVF